MGRASSAKKIARVAAASGDRSARRQRNIGYSAALVIIVVVGLLLVAWARSQNQLPANNVAPRANLGDGKPGDHWHAAFAVDICGQEQPAVQDSTAPDVLGIHTHGDGIIHIHPFASSAAGKRATLAKFFDRVGLKASPSQIRMPDGKIYRAGETTCAGKAAEIVIAHWKSGPTAAAHKPTTIFRTAFDKVDLTENYGAFTLAFVPRGGSVQAPSSAANIVSLGQADAGSAATSPSAGQTVPAGSSGTGSPSGSSPPVTQ